MIDTVEGLERGEEFEGEEDVVYVVGGGVALPLVGGLVVRDTFGIDGNTVETV